MLPSVSRSIFDPPAPESPAPFGLVIPRPLQPAAAIIPASRDWFGNVIVVMFLIAQLLDFIFTYLGVTVFGVREGNPLLEHSMHAMGLGTTDPMSTRYMVCAGIAVGSMITTVFLESRRPAAPRRAQQVDVRRPRVPQQ